MVAENPQLHLIWFHDRIFIKPIPRYLLSHAFWEYLQTEDQLAKTAAGFLRTYSYLIRYESDFRLASSEELGLIPPDDGANPVTFERFAKFIRPFALLKDSNVNPRHHFGELRLTRLNICARLFLGKLTFHHMHPQWRSYLGQFFGPLLSIFAIFSVVLSAMQVGLAAQGFRDVERNWTVFSSVSRWFSLATILLVAIGVLLLIALIIFMGVHDIWFAQSVLRQKKRSRGYLAVDFKSGVI